MERKLIAEADSKELQNEKARIDFKTYKKEKADSLKSERNRYACYSIQCLGNILSINPALSSISIETREIANTKMIELIKSIEI